MEYSLKIETVNKSSYGDIPNTYSVKTGIGYIGKICMNNDFDKKVQDPIFYYKANKSIFDFSKTDYRLGDNNIYKSIIMKNVGHNEEDLMKWLQNNENKFVEKLCDDLQWYVSE